MKSPAIPHPTRAHRRLAIALLGLAIGCANPGAPRPPSLHLPQVVNNLTAERIGNDVQLHWTTPSRTTDDLDLKGALTAEICRETLAPTGQPSSSNCIAIKRLPVRPGPTQATDPLNAPLTTDPPALFAYRIQIFNANGHSAGLSPRAFAAAGTTPPPVEHLRATPNRIGAKLEWQPQTPPYPIELDRLLITTIASPNPTPKPAKQSLNLTQPPPTEVRLLVDNQPTDSSGTIDRSAMKGQTYRYTAQRLRKISLAGHALELRSVPSPPITIVMRDIFPPSPPTGLAAIPGGTGPADRSIDLSWEPVMDPDLAGYIVYRQPLTPSGAPAGPATRLSPTPIPTPAFRDQTAVPGQSYAYRVTSIDTTGNESAPSADVQETIREQ